MTTWHTRTVEIFEHTKTFHVEKTTKAAIGEEAEKDGKTLHLQKEVIRSKAGRFGIPDTTREHQDDKLLEGEERRSVPFLGWVRTQCHNHRQCDSCTF